MFEAFDFKNIADSSSVDLSVPCVPPCDSRNVSREDLKLLCEIGVLALAIERGEDALPIFELLDQQQPHNAAGSIGIAMIEASAGRERDAFARLRRAVSTKRLCVREAKAVLAIFLMGFGRQAEAKALRRDLMRGPDCGARRLIMSYGTA
jgi:predicted Zn-dependent protease